MKNVELKGLKAIKEDIMSLRGSEVKVFGQPQVIASEVDELSIDILDIIDKLDGFEVEEIEVIKPCEYCDNSGTREIDGEEVECEHCDGEGVIYEEMEAPEAIERIFEDGDLKELKCDNSYNWGSPVSNDFCFTTYKDLNNDKIYVEFKVHRYGDVRCNYTDVAILEFTNDVEFLEAISECNKNIEVDGFDCTVNVFSDTIEVYKDDEYVGDVCVDDMEELKEKLARL